MKSPAPPAGTLNRRRLLLALPALPLAGAALESNAAGDLDNPYADIDWDRCEFLPSMSHQHQGQTDASRDVFREMGYRHFAFSNYYPSAPTYPLPEAYLERHPDLIGAPNAEQHSFTDAGLHFNSLGSLLATGYGSSIGSAARATSPLIHRFEGLTVFSEARPWAGVYRLDVQLEAVQSTAETQPEALLTLTGAQACDFRNAFADQGPVREKPLAAGSHTLYLRTTAPVIEMRLDYPAAGLRVTQCRLMQGSNRPWRDVFRAALDGEEIDGRRSGGLLDPEGGGITLNHPTGKLDDYTAMLDYDPRVLGIEVWNQLTSGFGSERGFYSQDASPPAHFYRLWDAILATGRRCWGFFVKDHNTYGRGRNILVVPPLADLDRSSREAAALRAYRRGAFFGSISALATDDQGNIVAPYDRSDFRFQRIDIRRDAGGKATALAVSVAGQDTGRRPQVQIRFVTDQGIAAVADATEAEFALPRDAAGRLIPAFVRVEAIAYPATHLGGQPLTPAFVRERSVAELARLHDRQVDRGQPGFFGNPAELRTPIPIADLIFLQPFRRI